MAASVFFVILRQSARLAKRLDTPGIAEEDAPKNWTFARADEWNGQPPATAAS
jgi:hypothetical protein